MGTFSQSRTVSNFKNSNNIYTDADIPKLSKSRFQMGLQCSKALYYACYHPDLADAPSELMTATQKNGDMVGRLAHDMFPGGVLIDEDYYDRNNAMAHTQQAMSENAPAIFEATFMHNNVLVKNDILQNNGDGTYDLIEVKSATSLKNQNITDVAVQLNVLEGAGIKVRNAYLMRLNPKYVYNGGEHDLDQLFVKDDITDIAKKYARVEVKHDLKRMHNVLRNHGREPKCDIGKQCTTPFQCSFYRQCHENLPEHPITELPRLSDKLMTRLQKDNIMAIKDIPEGYGLSEAQEKVRQVVLSNDVKVDPSVKKEFRSLNYPLHFLDFETMQTVVPEYKGTRPYQQIPFQWSDHIMNEPDAEVSHEEFLHQKPGKDPRKYFVESLLKTVEKDEGHIVVYSDFEKSRLQELARDYPQYDTRIAKVIDRLYNLEKTVRTSVSHPDFKGKTSIKYVLPAVVKENDYKGLSIGNGGVAMTRYRQAINGEIPQEEASQVYKDLLVYCGVDTMSMVKVFNALKDIKTVKKDYKDKQKEKLVDEPPF